MAQACPINFTAADNTVSRILSLLTTGIVALFFLTGVAPLLFALGADLLVRLHGNKHFSPLYQSAVLLKRLMRLPEQKVDGAAKSVAGHFGLLFILLLIVAASLGLQPMLVAVASIYVLCLLMDVLFNFCVGCKVYYLYRLIGGAA
ncbi:DUF4395 family protein [Sulfurimonas diazotrophicus]|uniref:DUF4395 family protein n=1 Tax=Sulfurimonas diazotrophicus TaxID=3131939 RepID=A0ABZ3HEC8_9BACT